MNLVRTILAAVPLALGYLCAATTVAQLVGGAVLWSEGVLSRPKLVRYAAILYGFELPPADDRPPDEEHPSQLTREQLLASRLQAGGGLADRVTAVRKGTETIRALEQDLKLQRTDRYKVRQNLRIYLDELEQEAVRTALQNVQQTLESLKPRQAKDLLVRMLDDEGLDPEDDVVGDVITIVKAMPQDKLKKVLAEFKSDPERSHLHRILLEIGNLQSEEDDEDT